MDIKAMFIGFFIYVGFVGFWVSCYLLLKKLAEPRDYFNPGDFKKDVKKMVTLANGKTEQEKLSEDWQRVSDDFARAWEKVISEKAKRSAE